MALPPPNHAAMREHRLGERAPGWSILTDGFIIAPSEACIRTRATREDAMREAVWLARTFAGANPESLALAHGCYPRWRDCVASFVDWHIPRGRADESAALVYLAIERDAAVHGIDWPDVLAAVAAGNA